MSKFTINIPVEEWIPLRVGTVDYIQIQSLLTKGYIINIIDISECVIGNLKIITFGKIE